MPRNYSPLTIALLSLLALPAIAQQALPPDEIARREREAREAQQREAERARPVVREEAPRVSDYRDTTLPEEAQCFPLTSLVLTGERVDEFGFAQRYLNQYAGRCVGAEGVGLIARRVGDLILDRGYVTTRVGVPEQSLSSGELRLLLVPGVLRDVIIDGDTPGNWKTALPLRPGDLINLRAIEQGLEQFKRLPSQDVTIDMAPGDQPGQSDVVIHVQRRRGVRGVVSIDDSGSEATGRIQGNASLGWDNPLGLNDILNIGYGHDLVSRDSERGTRSRNLGYSLPWGHWQFDVNASAYDYHQTVTGSDLVFLSSGHTVNRGLSLSRTLHRGQKHRTGIELRVGQYQSRSYIEGTELENQRRDTTSAELALRHRLQLGNARIDARIAQRRGIPWLGGQRDVIGTPKDYPTFGYRLNTFDLSVDLPFPVGEKTLFWTSELRGQQSDDPLYGTEQFSIGSRYSVRGYSGEQPLVAENGIYWRNTLTFPLASDISVYAGLDAGQIGGDSAAYLPGRRLTGTVVGLRGGVAGISYDVFTGRGIRAPKGVDKAPVIGVQVAVAF